MRFLFPRLLNIPVTPIIKSNNYLFYVFLNFDYKKLLYFLFKLFYSCIRIFTCKKIVKSL